MNKESEALQWILNYAKQPKYASQDGTVEPNFQLSKYTTIIEQAFLIKEQFKDTISKIYQIARRWFDDVHADGNDSMNEIFEILKGQDYE